jgi:hypothetical protein
MLQIAVQAPAPFYLSTKNQRKIMVAKEVYYYNYHNFYPIRVQHASIHVKNVILLNQKRQYSR